MKGGVYRMLTSEQSTRQRAIKAPPYGPPPLFYSLYGSSIYIRTMHTGEGKTKNPGWPASRISYLTSIFPSIPLTIQEQRKECGT